MNIACNTCNIVIAPRTKETDLVLAAKKAHEAQAGHYPNATHETRVAVGKWAC
jgi:hypothetical protein